MPLSHSEMTSEEVRYDPETLKKVIELAGKLQHEGHSHLTASEMEQFGAEVGLDPTYIRKALAQIDSNQRSTANPVTKNVVEPISVAELASAIVSLSVPIAYGSLAFITRFQGDTPVLLAEVIAGPTALLLGFIAGKPKIGFVSGLVLALTLTPAFDIIIKADGPYMIPIAILGAWLGHTGASLRQKYFPFASERRVKTSAGSTQPETQSKLEVRFGANPPQKTDGE